MSSRKRWGSFLFSGSDVMRIRNKLVLALTPSVPALLEWLTSGEGIETPLEPTFYRQNNN